MVRYNHWSNYKDGNLMVNVDYILMTYWLSWTIMMKNNPKMYVTLASGGKKYSVGQSRSASLFIGIFLL